jgi:hypothetical protein
MKKKLSYSLVLGILLLTTASFALINNRPVKPAGSKKAIVSKASKFTCVADIVYGSTHLISWTSSAATIGWSTSGSPASCNYGGYYNNTSPTINLPAGNVVGAGPDFQLTIPIPSGTTSFRIGFAAKCSDGTLVGSTHGALVYPNGTTVQF